MNARAMGVVKVAVTVCTLREEAEYVYKKLLRHRINNLFFGFVKTGTRAPNPNFLILSKIRVLVQVGWKGIYGIFSGSNGAGADKICPLLERGRKTAPIALLFWLLVSLIVIDC